MFSPVSSALNSFIQCRYVASCLTSINTIISLLRYSPYAFTKNRIGSQKRLDVIIGYNIHEIQNSFFNFGEKMWWAAHTISIRASGTNSAIEVIFADWERLWVILLASISIWFNNYAQIEIPCETNFRIQILVEIWGDNLILIRVAQILPLNSFILEWIRFLSDFHLIWQSSSNFLWKFGLWILVEIWGDNLILIRVAQILPLKSLIFDSGVRL